MGVTPYIEIGYGTTESLEGIKNSPYAALGVEFSTTDGDSKGYIKPSVKVTQTTFSGNATIGAEVPLLKSSSGNVFSGYGELYGGVTKSGQTMLKGNIISQTMPQDIKDSKGNIVYKKGDELITQGSYEFMGNVGLRGGFKFQSGRVELTATAGVERNGIMGSRLSTKIEDVDPGTPTISGPNQANVYTGVGASVKLSKNFTVFGDTVYKFQANRNSMYDPGSFGNVGLRITI